MKLRRESRLMLVVCVAANVVVGLPASGVLAEDAADEHLLRAQKTRQQHVAAIHKFVAGLDLSPGQVRTLLPLLDQAAASCVEFNERHAVRQVEMIEAFRDFAREDSLNQGFSPAVRRRTARANREAASAHRAYQERLLKLEGQAESVLSRSQHEYAQAFWPRWPGKTVAKNTRKKPERIRRKGAPRTGRNNGPKRQTAIDRRLAAAEQEASALKQQIHPRLGPTGTYLFDPEAAESICRIGSILPSQTMREALELLERGTSDYSASARSRDNAELAKLRAEINNWNLINGLHLGGEQIQRIVRLYGILEAQREASKAGPAKRKAKKNQASRQISLSRLEKVVEKVMTAGQRQVLADYRACLIPPKNLNNPVRVGQASDNSHLERWLSRARDLAVEPLDQLIDELLENEAHRFGELGSDARGERRSLLWKTVREATELSDAEFEINKADLAQRMVPRNRLGELTQRVDALARRKGRPGKIAQFILKPAFIEQLRYRSQQLTSGVVTEPTDLAIGPQAPNCKKGCAVKPEGKNKNRKKP